MLPGHLQRVFHVSLILGAFMIAFIVMVMWSHGHFKARFKAHKATTGYQVTNKVHRDADKYKKYKYNEYNKNTNLTNPDDEEFEELLQMLKTRTENFKGQKFDWRGRLCSKTRMGTPCLNETCPGHFSKSPRERLRQVLSVRSNTTAHYLRVMASATKPVTSHKYIFVTGASSNHFHEMQALVYTMYQNVFPRMKGKDYAFVLFNLGLTDTEIKRAQKNCRCTILDFPFAGLPDFIKNLKCYAWKPLVVASLLEKAEYLVWVDASVRWANSTLLDGMFRRAKATGYLGRHNVGVLAHRTNPMMARFFGDHLCQYSSFYELQSGFVIYYNDRFVREAVIQPWVACAMNTTCMCFKGYSRYRSCVRPVHLPNGRCHRFDQSATGIILSKLFLENINMVYLSLDAFTFRRRHQMNWFNST